MQQTTPWYHSIARPTRTGWYEVTGTDVDNPLPPHVFRMFFNGIVWKWEANHLDTSGTPVLPTFMRWRGLAAPAIEQTLDRYFPSEEQQQELRELLMDANDKQIACNNAWMKLSSHLRTKGWI